MVILILSMMLTTFVRADVQNQTLSQKSYSRKQILSILKSLEGKIEPSIEMACQENATGIKVLGCSDSGKVMSDYVISVSLLAKLSSEIEQYDRKLGLDKHIVQKLQVHAIKEKISCMQNFYKNFTFTCRKKDPVCQKQMAIAYVLRADAGKNKRIYLCPFYRLADTYKFRASILLHELSHHCGTYDLQYLHDEQQRPIRFSSRSKSGLKVDVSHLNAANFDYWADKGFCLPEFDCHKK